MNVYILNQNQSESINKKITNFIRIEPMLITKGEYSGNYFLSEKIFENPHCCHIDVSPYQKVWVNSISDLM